MNLFYCTESETVFLKGPRVEFEAGVAPRAGANQKLDAPAIKLPQPQVNANPTNSKLQPGAEVYSPKVERAVRVPKVEMPNGSKLDTGAKVGGLTDSTSDGTKQKMNVESLDAKAKSDINAIKTQTVGGASSGAKAPTLAVSARAPKAPVQMGAPQGSQIVCLVMEYHKRFSKQFSHLY